MQLIPRMVRILVAFILIASILFIMSDPIVWGMLPKAQDDATTIDDAIAQAIADHLDDPQAHIESGQSLETHRANDVIDHPAGSVLADKASVTEWILNTVFETLDAWNIVGDVTNGDVAGAQLYVEHGVTGTSKIYARPQTPVNFFNSASYMLYQIYARFDLSNTSYNAYFGYLTSHVSTNDGFGFQVRAGALYAHVRCGTTTSETLLTGVTLSDAHIYRAQYSPAENHVVFYIDGVIIATINRPTGTTWEDDRGPEASISTTASNDGRFLIANMYASRSL